jgi:hypothetical protein
VVRTVRGRPVTWRRLERPSDAVGVASSGAPASGTAPTAVVMAGAPPPSNELAQEALVRWVIECGWLEQWRLGFDV